MDPDALRSTLAARLPTQEPFTLATAVAAGLTKKQLAVMVGRDLLRHPIRNVYVSTDVADSIDLRARMLALVVPDDCFVCDRTAAWLHGAPAALAPGEHLVVPPVSCFRPSAHGRLRNKLSDSGERHVLPSDLTVVSGILVTTPLRTALDLGRLQPNRDIALAGLDAMLRLGVPSEDLLRSVGRFDRQRGIVQLRFLAPLADGRAQSAGESALRLRWYDAGLPRPELQIVVEVHGRLVALLDLGLEEELFAAEYDGEQWHTEDEDVEHDTERRTWLTEQRGWWIEVFRRDHVHGMHQDADIRLRVAYADLRRRVGRRTVIST